MAKVILQKTNLILLPPSLNLWRLPLPCRMKSRVMSVACKAWGVPAFARCIARVSVLVCALQLLSTSFSPWNTALGYGSVPSICTAAYKALLDSSLLSSLLIMLHIPTNTSLSRSDPADQAQPPCSGFSPTLPFCLAACITSAITVLVYP